MFYEPIVAILGTIGIFFLPFLTLGFIVWLIIKAVSRRREREHEERMAMIQRGINPTPEPGAFEPETNRSDRLLVAGIIIAVIGLMLVLPSFGFLLLFIGLGLICLSLFPWAKVLRRREQKILLSGIIVTAMGAWFYFDSFGLFLLILGLGLIAYYFIVTRKRAAPVATQPSEPQGAKQPETTGPSEPGEEKQPKAT